MKSLLLVSLVTLSLSAFAQYAPAPAQMRANYETCQQQPYWHQRWGQYVVAFSHKEATKACNHQYGPGYSYPKLTGCYSTNGWIKAGYYCEEIRN